MGYLPRGRASGAVLFRLRRHWLFARQNAVARHPPRNPVPPEPDDDLLARHGAVVHNATFVA